MLNALTAQAAQIEYPGQLWPGRSCARIADYDAQISRYRASLKRLSLTSQAVSSRPGGFPRTTAVIPLDLLNL